MSDALFAGRAAIVVGGSRGVGRAVAELLAELGAAVVVNGRTADAVTETVSSITGSGGLGGRRGPESPEGAAVPAAAFTGGIGKGGGGVTSGGAA